MKVTDLAVDVARRLDVLRDRIATAGGDPDQVRVVAMTKGFGPEAVVAAAAAGLHDVGENYARELLDKSAALRHLGGPLVDVRWNYLGAIQRNKVPALAPLVSCWQTVAREVEGAAIARRRPGAEVLVEVAVTDDPGRNGCPPASVPDLVAALGTMDLVVHG